jgi:peptide subunit release factor 1 (eRF1)
MPGAMVVQTWSVCWTDERHVRRIVDFESRAEADCMAVLLAEAARKEIIVAGPVEMQMDMERIDVLKERILSKMRGLAADYALHEASGGTPVQ